MFNKEYFLLEKKNNSFQFIGPNIADAGAVTTGAMLGGAIGGAIAAASSKLQKRYEIDLYSGLLLKLESLSSEVGLVSSLIKRVEKFYAFKYCD